MTGKRSDIEIKMQDGVSETRYSRAKTLECCNEIAAGHRAKPLRMLELAAAYDRPGRGDGDAAVRSNWGSHNG